MVLRSIKDVESELEAKFYRHWIKHYHPMPVLQYHFHPERQWRFDFCWPNQRVAVEIQGQGPGHSSLPGMTNDCDKGNAARQLKWTVLYFTCIHLSPEKIDGTCIFISSFLGIHHAATNPTYSQDGFRSYIPAAKRKRRPRN